MAAWAYDTFFRGVHGNRLIYNACWEDPALDRELLGLNATSRVVMITSAGCNALDYLLDGPAEIHAIDANPRQNALLELKMAVIERCAHDDLFRLFGDGAHKGFPEVLERVGSRLGEDSREFWHAKRRYFDPRHFKKSFYFQGSAGDVAWTMRTLVLKRCPTLWRNLEALLEARSLEEQEKAFALVEPELWNRFSRWLVRQPVTLSFLGVPRAQTRLITEEYPGGMLGFVRDKLRHVATRLPMRDNYFWRVYATGSYTRDCCPNYLKPENFEVLRQRTPRIQTHSMFLSRFLSEHPAPYSHYVLLDHQDWLAWHDPVALGEEWRLILENSRPGTRKLFRSAAPRVDFLPGFVAERIRFNSDQTDRLHPMDRVGTYGSLHLGEVR